MISAVINELFSFTMLAHEIVIISLVAQFRYQILLLMMQEVEEQYSDIHNHMEQTEKLDTFRGPIDRYEISGRALLIEFNTDLLLWQNTHYDTRNIKLVVNFNVIILDATYAVINKFDTPTISTD